MTAADPSAEDLRPVGRFTRHSFRAKFILVVGAAVLFDLLLSGGIAIWNVQRLSRDATEQAAIRQRMPVQQHRRFFLSGAPRPIVVE